MLAASESNTDRKIRDPSVGDRELSEAQGLSDLRLKETALAQSVGWLGAGKTSSLW